MTMTIADALKLLDPSNPDHWTTDGLPLVDAVRAASGLGDEVSRQAITDAAPEFNREAAQSIPEQPEAKDDDTTPRPGDDLAAQLAELEKEVNELQEDLGRIQDEIQAKERAISKLRKILHHDRTPQSDTLAQQAFIKKQIELRAERANRLVALKGIDPKDLQVRSPIDRAIAQNNEASRKKEAKLK